MSCRIFVPSLFALRANYVRQIYIFEFRVLLFPRLSTFGAPVAIPLIHRLLYLARTQNTKYIFLPVSCTHVGGCFASLLCACLRFFRRLAFSGLAFSQPEKRIKYFPTCLLLSLGIGARSVGPVRAHPVRPLCVRSHRVQTGPGFKMGLATHSVCRKKLQ